MVGPRFEIRVLILIATHRRLHEGSSFGRHSWAVACFWSDILLVARGKTSALIVMATTWQVHGKTMARAWQEHGRSMARAWQEHGSTAHAQYAWSAGCGIACPSHYILRSPKATTNFTTPGVAFGTMTVAAVVGFQIYNLQIALAQADREF